MRTRLWPPVAMLALALGIAAGCSAIVESDLTRVNCSWEGAIGPPACPVDHTCRAGVCSPCGSKEICGDGVDNDCSGTPDDGCNDGGLGGSGGIGGDASGGVGGGGVGGAAGAGGTGGSGGSTGGAGGSTGGVGGSTGGGGGTGATGGSGGTSAGGLGAPCTNTAACDTGLFCDDPAVFGATSGPLVCMSACCKSEDCGSGPNVCFPATGGGSACVPAASVGRADLGAKPAGATCSKHGDCRSGLCEANKCFDACCKDTDCSPSEYCTKRVLPGTTRNVMACGAPAGSGGLLAPCSTGGCQSGLCLNTAIPACSKSCCTTKDCAGTVSLGCIHSGGLRYCGAFTGGTKSFGAACANSAECKSGRCLGPTGGPYYCSDTCCGASDCGPGYACRAATVGGTNQLLCVKL